MIYVVVGVVPNDKKEILVTQRPVQKTYSGYWEFPGGKQEPNESSFETLARELKEELDINVLSAEPWKKMQYTYPDKVVFLDIWVVTAFSGELTGMENQDFQWVPLDKLQEIDFLPANKMILEEVRAKFA